MPLDEFSDEEADELVAHGKTCDRPFFDDECRRIRELAGCHPAHLQLACRALYEAKGKGVVDWPRLESDWRRQVDFTLGRSTRPRRLLHWLDDKLILLGATFGFFFKRDKTESPVYRVAGIIVLIVLLLVVFGIVQLPAVQDWLKIMTGAK